MTTAARPINDVSDWLDAGGDPEDLDRLAATAPLWEPAPEPIAPPYRDAAESMAAVNAMAKTSREKRSTDGRLCDQVAEWFDRNGPNKLEKAFPIAYVARSVGVSRCHFHRLGQFGRVRRLLRARNTTEDIDRLSDRGLSPLTKLLDRPTALQGAFSEALDAQRAAEAEREQIRKCGGRPPQRRQLAGYVRDAVRPLLPEAPEANPAQQIALHANRLFAAATSTPGAPRELVEAARTARRVAREWVRGPAPRMAIGGAA